MNVSGIINIYKEQNMTSHDVVGKLRRIFGVRRVGHTGTLDPMATGVLPVCIGRSARVTEYLDTDLKKYRCRMLLGRDTNTYDVWGEDVPAAGGPQSAESAAQQSAGAAAPGAAGAEGVTEDDVRRVLASFSGRITQKPPLYSAVKVSGKRLYEYARKGKNVEIPEREVYIKSLEVVDMDLSDESGAWVVFDVECTKGTFVRSVCHDAGVMLGCGAVMSELERLASGAFEIDSAVTIDELKALAEQGEDAVKEAMFRPDEALSRFGTVLLEAKDAVRLINGLEIEPACYRIAEEPYFKENDFYFPVREEYKRMYRLYADMSENVEIPGRPNGTEDQVPGRGTGNTVDNKLFIGLGLMTEEDRHLHPEKIFI